MSNTISTRSKQYHIYSLKLASKIIHIFVYSIVSDANVSSEFDKSNMNTSSKAITTGETITKVATNLDSRCKDNSLAKDVQLWSYH